MPIESCLEACDRRTAGMLLPADIQYSACRLFMNNGVYWGYIRIMEKKWKLLHYNGVYMGATVS